MVIFSISSSVKKNRHLFGKKREYISRNPLIPFALSQKCRELWKAPKGGTSNYQIWSKKLLVRQIKIRQGIWPLGKNKIKFAKTWMVMYRSMYVIIKNLQRLGNKNINFGKREYCQLSNLKDKI